MTIPRDFWTLWQGQLVSQMGTQAFQVLALFWLAKNTGSASAGAAFLALSLIPPVLFGPALARWGRKFAPRTVMVSCDAVASCLALPVLLALVMQAPTQVVVAMLLMANGMLALVHALMMPTLHSSVPLLVPKEQLLKANGWMITTQQIASVLGQGLGGVAYGFIGPAGLCMANMLGFALSGMWASRLQAPAARETPVQVSAAPRAWAMLRANGPLRRLATVSAVFNVLYAPWIVLLPFHLMESGQGSPATMGWVLAGCGAGSLMGNLLLQRLSKLGGSAQLPLALGFQALCLMTLGCTHGAVQTAAVLFVMGAGIGFVNVQLMTRMQNAVAPADRSQAIAVVRSTVHIATPLGYGFVAFAQHSLQVSPGTVYGLSGLLLLLALLPFAPGLVRDARELEQGSPS